MAGVFTDAVFLWHPGDEETAPFDLVSEVSAEDTTTGAIVTTDGHVGRAHVGSGVASSFDTPALTPPIADLHPGVSWSAFGVSRIGSTGWQEVLFFGEKADGEEYAYIRTRRGNTGETSNRISSVTPGDAAWPFVSTPDVGTSGEFVVSIVTYETTGANTATMTAYQDSATPVGTDTANTPNATTVDRVRIGALGDKSPGWSTAGEVYAAGIWGRVLTGDEIDEILADPFAYLTEPEPEPEPDPPPPEEDGGGEEQSAPFKCRLLSCYCAQHQKMYKRSRTRPARPR